MAYDATKPANDDYLATFPPEMREQLRAIIHDMIVNALSVQGLTPGNTNGNIPVSNGVVCAGLNAEKVGGNPPSAFATAGHTHSAATTSSNGFMANTDKLKLDGIAAGAEVNQNTFSSILVGGTTIQADGKTDTLELVPGTNIALVPDATNDKVTISVTGTVATATKLATARTINGISFDGSGNITVADSTKAPIAHSSSATTYGISTASVYGHAMASSATPLVAGTAAVGTDNGKFAREGHVHPAQTTVTGNAGTATKLATARIISLTGDVSGSGSFDGSANISIAMTNSGAGNGLGLTNFIASGLKMTPESGLAVDIGIGQASVGGGSVTIDSNASISLSARTSSIAYLSNTGTLGKVDAVFPAVDANTIARWIIDGSSSIANSAVGVNGNTIAVANALTKSGTVTQVDGWIGYGGKGNGSTGYYTGANLTGFPSGAAVRELDLLFTPLKLGVQQVFLTYGTPTNSQYISLKQLANNNLGLGIFGTDYDTGFTLEIGNTYFASYQYDGSNILIYVNGVLVYKVAASLNTVLSSFSVFRDIQSSYYYANAILHYIEIRKVLRTSAQLGSIANKLCLPCCYTRYSGAYPTVSNGDTSTYHEWRFAETSGSTVTDTQTTSPLTGTASGTTIVHSDIISSAKARKFNGSSDVVTVGSLQFASQFTVIGIINPSLITQNSGFLGNYNGTNGNIFGVNGTIGGGKFAVWNPTNSWQVSNTTLSVNYPNFVACSCNNSQMTLYVNSPLPDIVIPFVPYTSSALSIQIGAYGNNSGWFGGIIDYLIYIPRALSQAEIAQYYNFLMATTTKTIVDDMCPANSLLLGFVQTGSSTITSYDDSSWKYGRREGAYNGNRKVFLGWRYFSGSTTLTWNNPFGTRKVKAYYTWAQDANGTNESDINTRYSSSTSWFGLNVSCGTSAQRIMAETMANGIGAFNGTTYTSGYIGCYAEVIE